MAGMSAGCLETLGNPGPGKDTSRGSSSRAQAPADGQPRERRSGVGRMRSRSLGHRKMRLPGASASLSQHHANAGILASSSASSSRGRRTVGTRRRKGSSFTVVPSGRTRSGQATQALVARRRMVVSIRKSRERACRGPAWRFPVATPVTAVLSVRVYPAGGGSAQVRRSSGLAFQGRNRSSARPVRGFPRLRPHSSR